MKTLHYTLALLGLVVGAAGCGRASDRDLETARTFVRPGIDVLLSDSLHLVTGHRIGLVSNHAGVDAEGVHDVERLRSAGITIEALFSPEHGFRGAAAPGEAVDHSVDSTTGLPIYSLYGRTSSPTPEMLSGIDVFVVDLPDAGARYFTYITTTADVMRAAGAAGIPVLVLDRPNPIGGRRQGNINGPDHRSAVGLLSVPMRHGLTIGEQALLAREELAIDVDLTVVPLDGWDRSMAFDQTGLPFIRPSPNLPTLESLFHYPGLCLFEGTALSVGRGSKAPFEQIGAPWLDTAAVLTTVRAANLPGVAFEGVTFIPTNPGDGKFPGRSLAGIRLRVTDRAAYDPTVAAVHLLTAVWQRHGGDIGWFEAHFDRLAGGPAVREAVAGGASAGSIVAPWPGPLERFDAQVEPSLLYRP
jgi:uncharacterized protein YbbC (DUF1343 family)